MSYSLHMQEQFQTHRRAEDVFDYIVDFSRIDEWDHSIVDAKKISDGLIGVGTIFDVTYKMGLRKVPIQYKVSEYEPHSKAVLVGESDNFTAIDTVTIQPKDDPDAQGCQVTWDAHIEFRGAAAKLLPLMKNKVEQAGRKTIQDLAFALDDNFALPKPSGLQKLADKLVIPGMAGFTKFGYRQAKKRWQPVTRSVKGKHIIVSGATSGLGLATALDLAARGAHLTLVARDESKGQGVVDQIKRQTGNTHIALEIADLSLMANVKALSQRLLEKGDAIDVLVNNAGALFNEYQVTSEGFEKSFALLLLSPYLLTEALHPMLVKAGNARVINVSSGGMYAKRISINNLQTKEEGYRGTGAYAMCKRGLVIMSERWAEKWASDNISVHCMHPGWAATPGVESSLPTFNRIMKYSLRSSEEGADTITWLACANEVDDATGLFWLDRVPHTTHLFNSTRENDAQRDQLEQTLEAYKLKLWQ